MAFVVIARKAYGERPAADYPILAVKVKWEALLNRKQLRLADPNPCHPEVCVLCGPKDRCNLAESADAADKSTGPSARKERGPQDDKTSVVCTKHYVPFAPGCRKD
jgi:hypothetical protein